MVAIRVGQACAGRIRVRSGHDEQAATVARCRGIDALVEQDRVVLDTTVRVARIVVDEPKLRHPGAVTGRQVAAHPVVIELVIVIARTEGDAAGTRSRGREQLITLGRVVRDIVVVHVHFHVKAERQLGVGGKTSIRPAGTRLRIDCPREVAVRMLSLAHRDTARQRSLVVVDAVVRDLQIVSPAVHKDAAAALGAVGHCQAVDARGVALEVARERIRGVAIAGVTPAVRVARIDVVRIHEWVTKEQRRTHRERVCRERKGSGGETHALGEHGDARAFISPQPTVASSGKRSTCGLLPSNAGEKSLQLVPHVRSYPAGTPLGVKPNKHTILRRQSLRIPAGCALASMMLEAAPTPCRRTGFHITSSSW